MFFKIGVLKNFIRFTGKHLCWSLFLIKLQAFRPAKLQHCCFPFKLVNFLKTLSFAEHLRWLLLYNTEFLYLQREIALMDVEFKTPNRQKQRRKNKRLVSQNNRLKMQTEINSYGTKYDHTQTIIGCNFERL